MAAQFELTRSSAIVAVIPDRECNERAWNPQPRSGVLDSGPAPRGAFRNDLRINSIQADQLLMPDEKPYRPNVGIALFNASGQVLIGRRFRDDGPEIILPGLEWQMPQGGINADENPRDAMMRELWEETGVLNATYLGETEWLTYEFPPYTGPSSHRLAKFQRPAAEMVRAAFRRKQRRNRSADAAQRPAGGIRPVAMGAARPRRRSRGAVQARGVPDGSGTFREIRGMSRLCRYARRDTNASRLN